MSVIRKRGASSTSHHKPVMRRTLRKNKLTEIQSGKNKHSSILEDTLDLLKSVGISKEDIVFEFYNSMLDIIIKDCKVISEADNLPEICSICSEAKEAISDDGQNTTSVGSSSTKSTLKERSSKQNTISKEDEEVIEKEIVKIDFFNGNTYEGETLKRVMQGHGVFRWDNGTVYEGEFDDGFPTGKGTMTLPDLSFYEGQFCKGNFHGIGTFNIRTASILYSGSWKYGKKDGSGWILYDDDDWYDGEWKHDIPHGFGFRHFKNGSKYEGYWSESMRNGEGSIMFHNGDYYKGTWLNNQFHGYGEYTWKCSATKSLFIRYHNSYRGAWKNGMRSGIGIMQFETNTGAKLLGTWEENRKHGPGIMVCGNGLIIHSNPLFNCDKPIHITDKRKQNLEDKTSDVYETFSLTDVFKKIKKQGPMEEFDAEILNKIMDKGNRLTKCNFFHVASRTKLRSKFNPLKISVHSIADNINIDFFIEILTKKWHPEFIRDLQVEYSGSRIQFEPQRTKLDKYDKVSEHRATNELISLYLPKLNEIYNFYASLTVEDKSIVYKALLMRLFLWQFCKDIHLPEKGISLIQVDLLMLQNPSSSLETEHSPFEPIYFLQFIFALISISIELFVPEDHETIPEQGVLAFIFKHFLNGIVFQNSPNATDCRLLVYKDIIPITAAYDLYVEIGEPHSARYFLQRCCVKQGLEPPCYYNVLSEFFTNEYDKIIYPTSTMSISHSVYFIDDCTPTTKKTLTSHPKDPYYKTLYVFNSLGVTQVLDCLIKVCPQIASEGIPINMDYLLTFLEFYEVLLLCARKQVEIDINLETALSNKSLEKQIVKPDPRSTKGNIKISKKPRSKK